MSFYSFIFWSKTYSIWFDHCWGPWSANSVIKIISANHFSIWLSNTFYTHANVNAWRDLQAVTLVATNTFKDFANLSYFKLSLTRLIDGSNFILGTHSQHSCFKCISLLRQAWQLILLVLSFFVCLNIFRSKRHIDKSFYVTFISTYLFQNIFSTNLILKPVDVQSDLISSHISAKPFGFCLL